jgi:hypothetical protein
MPAIGSWQACRMRRLAWLLLVGAACNTGGVNNPPHDDAAFTPPGSITIRVRNDGARVLYVQASGGTGPDVTTIVRPDGSSMRRDTCELCNCATCPSCAVCGRTIASVAQIAPGASLDFTWDQIDWHVVEDGCRPTLACEAPALVPAGPLTARARFSDTTTMQGNETFIGPATTAETVFQHPTTDVVVVPIQ